MPVIEHLAMLALKVISNNAFQNKNLEKTYYIYSNCF